MENKETTGLVEPLRALACLIFSVLIWFGPIVPIVVDSPHTLLRSWLMYATTGRDLHRITYFQHFSSRDTSMIMDQEIVQSNGLVSYIAVRRYSIEILPEIKSSIASLCDSLSQDADIRARIEEPTWFGWAIAYEQEANLCYETESGQ